MISLYVWCLYFTFIVYIGVSIPQPQTLHRYYQAPYICKLSKPPFLGNLPSVLVFCDPPLKVGFSVFSVNPKNIKGFHS